MGHAKPLHVVGYYLNPQYFYDNPNIHTKVKVMKDFYHIIERLTPGQNI